ncbi:MAG: ATP-binding protein [Ferruginibacter sp.]
MKSFNILLFIAFSILFSGCNINKKKAAAKYTDFERGCWFYNQGKLDSAFFMFNQYVYNADDLLKKGAAYRYMGDMLWETGDVPGAEENATGAIQVLDSSDTGHYTELSYVYNLLGNIRFELQQYDDAISMFDKAKRFSTDSGFVFEILNNKALAFQKKGDYNDAVAIYDSMLLLKPTDQSLFARILDNRAKTKWLQNPEYPALPEFFQALKIRLDSQYNRGLNASYAHLSDYYEKINPDSALWYAKKMFQQAMIIESPADRVEALDKMIRLGDFSVFKSWYIEFKRLNDSLQLSRDTTKKIYALLRYDSQKNKADNLELKGRVTMQWVWLFILTVLAIAAITWLWNWYNKRRKRIREEADKAIQSAKLKTSQKVHDVVANGLYRIMNELEHNTTIERDPLLDKIEVLYEKSRDISYEEHLLPTGNPDYSKQVYDLLMAFNNEQTSVTITGNEQAFWSRTTLHQKNELELILTEIMVNMKKHSQARNVRISFVQEPLKGLITYMDDGIGFTAGLEFGNGLNNTVNRIESLLGDVTFGKNVEGGVCISISFPLQSEKT